MSWEKTVRPWFTVGSWLKAPASMPHTGNQFKSQTHQHSRNSLSCRKFGVHVRKLTGAGLILSMIAPSFRLASFAFAMIILGCESEAQQAIIRHPVADSVVNGSRPVTILSRDLPNLSRLSEMGRRLETMEVITSIGALSEPREEVFGEISDVFLDEEDRIWVLDSHYNDIRVFDAKGSFVRRIARPGRGPGELLRPLSIVRLNDTLYASQYDRSLNIYELESSEVLFVHRLSVPISAQDMCTIENRVFLQGVPLEGGPTVIPLDGQDPFGEMYRSGNPFVNSELNKGRLSCTQEGVVLGSQSVLNRLYGYTTDGSPRWVASFPDFLPIEAIEINQRFRVTVPEKGFTRLESLSTTEDGIVIAQLAFLSQDDISGGNPPSRLDTYLLDSTTGIGGFLSSDIPLILDLNERYALAMTNLDVPTLMVFGL